MGGGSSWMCHAGGGVTVGGCGVGAWGSRARRGGGGEGVCQGHGVDVLGWMVLGLGRDSKRGRYMWGTCHRNLKKAWVDAYELHHCGSV
jgi:hypothetical protein